MKLSARPKENRSLFALKAISVEKQIIKRTNIMYGFNKIYHIKLNCLFFLMLYFLLCLYSPKGASAPLKKTGKETLLTNNSHPIESTSIVNISTNYYKAAQKYFKERKRPLHHFLDIGGGAILVHSFFPWETTAYPFFVYLNYRRERWRQVKIPVIFSLQYSPLFSQQNFHRIHTLIGLRYPTSHDLNTFHLDLMMGASFPLSFAIEKTALELRLLSTHIIGPKSSASRLYFQWGAKAQIKKTTKVGLTVQLGLDNHL